MIMQALGIVELNSIASGIETTDAMLKAAQVELVTAQAICAGKYMILLQGDVAAMKSALQAGEEIAGSHLVNLQMIANLDPAVFTALMGAGEVVDGQAVGVIETFSVVTCVTASDTAVKASDISLIEIRLARGLGGKAFVVFAGEVSSVKAALDAAIEAHNDDGMIFKTVLVPQLHKDVLNAIM
jgi:microcompartment protein CcmL/EutN